ncbi:NAD(P)-dependent oxidoreductase [Nocardia sp. NBC_00511]|uniref:NAD(P)-dependent oxidoreductase n=1 Tax=Nocardia sp. NBC_00511 TaxID=2903591 RepID=UPI0030E0A2DD
MTNTQYPAVTVLGLGAMGSAIAATLVKAGVETTVWNRTPGRDAELVAGGAVAAGTVAEAVAGANLVIAVLLDHASVHEQLDPVAAALAGTRLINLTSTTPEQSRELAGWASDHGIDFLDGGIMAVPAMIGGPAASVLYSGSRTVFDTDREILELLGGAEYFDDDPGTAALLDFALLSAMYTMFGGFFQAAAMVSTAGISAEQFAPRATAWIAAMAQQLPGFARNIDTGEYTEHVVQDLRFTKSALDAIRAAAHDAGVSSEPVDALATLVDRQITAGHGAAAFDRITLELRAVH